MIFEISYYQTVVFLDIFNIIVHYYETDYIIMPPPYGGRYAIPRSVRLSVCLSVPVLGAQLP